MPNTVRLVLELCEGGELFDRIQQKQFYPEQESKVLIRNLLEAVAFIHSKGIMHRDLKPENILLASKVSNTDIKISDFGLPKTFPAAFLDPTQSVDRISIWHQR